MSPVQGQTRDLAERSLWNIDWTVGWMWLGGGALWYHENQPAALCIATLPGCAEPVGVETREELGNEQGKKKKQKNKRESQ